jgi:hypothetical protein
MSAENYPKANLKWPVVIQDGKRSIEGVTLTLNPNQAYIRCAKPLKLYEVIEMTRFLEISSDDRKVIAKEAFEHLKSKEVDSYKLEALQTIIIEQDEIGSEAA